MEREQERTDRKESIDFITWAMEFNKQIMEMRIQETMASSIKRMVS